MRLLHAMVILALAAPSVPAEENTPMATIEEVVVTPPQGKATHLSLSRDGNLVAYRLVGVGDKGIWLLDRRTGDHRLLVEDTPEQAHYAPAFSPDGKSIAFLAGEPVVPPSFSKVCVITLADGSRQEFPGSAFAWSPTSKRIAIAERETGTMKIATVKSGKTVETAELVPAWDPLDPPAMVWSPDGEVIAFTVSIPDQSVQGIRTTRAEKKDVAKVHDYEAKRAAIFPFWSPDGRLAWHVVMPGEKSWSEICAMDASGKPETIFRTELADAAGRPAWSPDGKSIAFLHTPKYHKHTSYGPTDVWVLDVATKQARALTNVGDAAGDLSWSEDGKTLILQAGSRIRRIKP